eukprot:SAG31_NODE_3015_length_4786_cov_2.418818_2_plen_120_part_00
MLGRTLFAHQEDGNLCEGVWENGKGNGKIRNASIAGRVELYEGEWIDLWPTTGKGNFIGHDGNLYVPDNAQWASGSGEGCVTHIKTNDVFWGSWEDRRPIDGRGKWVNSRGQVKQIAIN